MTATVPAMRVYWVPLLAVLAGLLLGVVDLGVQGSNEDHLAEATNSAAVWALAAFAVGVVVRRAALAALAGVITLVVGVATYYGAASVVYGDDLAVLTSPVAVAWTLLGVLCGVVFGTAGAWVRDVQPAQRAIGTALPVSVLFAEAITLLRVPDIGVRHTWAGIEIALGIALFAAVVLIGRRGWRDVRDAAVMTVLITLLGVAAYGLSHYGGS